MITLDPTLLAAQNSMSHAPIVKVESVSFTPSIPFEGQAFNTGTINEYQPDVIELATGEIASVITRNNTLILLITDTGKTEWKEYLIYTGGSSLVGSMTELLNGNLGVILIYSSSGTYFLRYLIVNKTGTVVTAVTTILSGADWMNAPSVERLADDTYILVHAYRNSSNEYSIQKRTSANFITWSAPGTIAPVGLDNLKRIDNTTIRQLASDEIFLLFDYQNDLQTSQELVNIYEIRSIDGGVTWTDPTKLTNNVIYGTNAYHPSIAERTDGSIEIVFQEEKELLLMNSTTPGWNDSYNSSSNCYFNPATGKITIKTGYTGYGDKPYSSTIIVDASSWVIEACYNSTSANPIEYGPYPFQWDSYDDGKWSVVWKQNLIAVLNLETDEWRYYIAADFPQFLIYKNIDIKNTARNAPMDAWVGVRIIDDILYLECYTGYFWSPRYSMGYIDLTAEADPISGWYDSWTFCVSWQYPAHAYQGHEPGCAIYPDVNMVLHSDTWPYYSDGLLDIFNFQGARVHHFDPVLYPGFPKWGLRTPILVNNHVYGNISYEVNYGNDARYGLCDINLETYEIRYHRPTWATIDQYNLGRGIDMGDGRLMFAVEPWGGGYGITVFDTNTLEWTLYDTNTLPGLPSNSWWFVAYDPVNNIIFSSGWLGLVAFSEDGNFQQIKYFSGTDTGAWVYGASSPLITQYTNSQPSIVIDSENVLWSLWTHKDVSEYSTYWDRENAEKDLSSYLTNSSIVVKWDMASVATLNFSLSHGHLFDPSNTMSTLAPFVKKGRKILLYFGELISGIEYFQEQGFYIVKDTKLSYTRGSYPVIQVNCSDSRHIWKQSRIPATDFFSDLLPEAIISNILQDHAGASLSEINIPTIVGNHTLYHQFIDQDIEEMITSILDHFNYFFYISSDMKYTAKQINFNATVNHTYTGTELINYTPDDSYSNFINRVIVKGEGRYELEVLYPSEIVGNLAGTLGWWGGTEVKRVWYSEDRKKKCRDPVLVVNISIQDFEIFILKGGGKEYISDEDHIGQYWVEITLEAPNLIAVFLGVLAAILAVGIKSLGCGLWNPCGPYIFALSTLTQIMGYLLGAVAQYEYEIWASPIGYTKQTFQDQADDLVLQRQLNGFVVSDEIDDPFCYTVNSCKTVAENELAIVKAQRNRISFTKPAHLQDEIGDIIQINHPYSNLPFKLFIPSLTREYQKGQGFFDKIEGWVL